MLLDCSSTFFLCLDSGWWLVIGTFVLAGVTLGLWVAAQKQLREQRNQFALLHKASVLLGSPQIGNHAITGDTMIYFSVKKIGDATAFGIRLRAEAHIRGIRNEPPVDQRLGDFSETMERLFIIPIKYTGEQLLNDQPPITIRASIEWSDLRGKQGTHFEAWYSHQIHSFVFETENLNGQQKV